MKMFLLRLATSILMWLGALLTHDLLTDIYSLLIAAPGRMWRQEIVGSYAIFLYLPICLVAPFLSNYKKTRLLLFAAPLLYPIAAIDHFPLRSPLLILSSSAGYGALYLLENIRSTSEVKHFLRQALGGTLGYGLLVLLLLALTGNSIEFFTPTFTPDNQKICFIQIIALLFPFCICFAVLTQRITWKNE